LKNQKRRRQVTSSNKRISSDELRKQKLLRFLESKEPVWRDEDHPELKDGAAEWVRKIRRGEIYSAPAAAPFASADPVSVRSAIPL
jgi:hypothetical protein